MATPSSSSPPAAADLVVVVYDTPAAFVRAKAQALLPNVRVLCDQVGEGLAPADFYAKRARSTLSDTFGVDDLLASNEELPLPFSNAVVSLKTVCSMQHLVVTGLTKSQSGI